MFAPAAGRGGFGRQIWRLRELGYTCGRLRGRERGTFDTLGTGRLRPGGFDVAGAIAAAHTLFERGQVTLSTLRWRDGLAG
jgi:hypothetical protein